MFLKPKSKSLKIGIKVQKYTKFARLIVEKKNND